MPNKKFRACVPVTVWVTVDNIEAEDQEEAEEKAYDEVFLQNFAGNNGYGKLIGTTSRNVSLECGMVDESKEITIEEI